MYIYTFVFEGQSELNKRLTLCVCTYTRAVMYLLLEVCSCGGGRGSHQVSLLSASMFGDTVSYWAYRLAGLDGQWAWGICLFLVVLVVGLQVQASLAFYIGSEDSNSSLCVCMTGTLSYPPNNFPNLLMFNVLKKCWTPVPGNCPILHSYLQRVRAPISVHHQILQWDTNVLGMAV